ncbi:hypothetical protein N658DRAFT_419580 [Parathielavia hyrcaniae]|uniref:Uncharacterized protein n=1 Tax=Parathielavia hyrcaniae TaxID=113614 RepID=A0AAN6Q793_9PEZI|nr:hypothetical protein N658DRAFT_419580 [Parathielavia hyrcaniae]
MKSTVLVAGLLASFAVAQPHGHGHGHHHKRKEEHGHHHKRGLVVHWVTETVTETAPPVVQPPPPPYTDTGSGDSGSGGPGTNDAGSGGSQVYTGELTYFKLGLGACGFDDSDKDLTENIVALSAELMGAQSNGNPMCNRKVTIMANGKTIQAVCRDKCPSCAVGDLDGTEKMFNELFGSLTDGRREIEWFFNPL